MMTSLNNLTSFNWPVSFDRSNRVLKEYFIILKNTRLKQEEKHLTQKRRLDPNENHLTHRESLTQKIFTFAKSLKRASENTRACAISCLIVDTNNS